MKLIAICSECGKDAIPFLTLKDSVLLKCGHLQLHSAPITTKSVESELEFKNLTGTKEAYEFQQETVEFLRDAGWNGFIAHSMGLGKTIIALLAARNNPELLPILVVVKSATTYNWMRETFDWLFDPNDDLACYIIQGGMKFIPPGFKLYIISMDSLSRNMEKSIKYDKGIDFKISGPLFKLGIKCVIVDECHSFKNDDSLRTKSLIQFIKGAEIKHKIFLSGTPIKNRADEFFVPLNLLDPLIFHSRFAFRNRWLLRETNDKGVVQWKRLHPSRIDKFHEMISRYYIRKEKIQVLKNLPAFSRDKKIITIEDPAVKNSYNAQLKIFRFKMDTEDLGSLSILGELAKLRRITGMAKIDFAIEWAEEFFEDAALEKMVDPDYPDKLAIGIHHKDVRDNLKLAFDARDSTRDPANSIPYKCLTLSGQDNAWEKDVIVQKFNKPDYRILVVNELAGGVGLNLQSCANTLVLERQWNAADEEQFESRFHRDGQTYPVQATYPIAKGTIDEYFDEMVEEKRAIFGDTISQSFQLTSDSTAIKQLAERTLSNPL